MATTGQNNARGRARETERDNNWRAVCPVHETSVPTVTEGEAKHCRNIHNAGCDERAARVERIRDRTSKRACVDDDDRSAPDSGGGDSG